MFLSFRSLVLYDCTYVPSEWEIKSTLLCISIWFGWRVGETPSRIQSYSNCAPLRCLVFLSVEPDSGPMSKQQMTATWAEVEGLIERDPSLHTVPKLKEAHLGVPHIILPNWNAPYNKLGNAKMKFKINKEEKEVSDWHNTRAEKTRVLIFQGLRGVPVEKCRKWLYPYLTQFNYNIN